MSPLRTRERLVYELLPVLLVLGGLAYVVRHERRTAQSDAFGAYPWMRVETAKRAEPFAAAQDVSTVARSRRGFMPAYKAAGSAGKLSPAWKSKRNAFVARHMAQVKGGNEALWKGDEPSRRHLALAMWAYSPDSSRFRHWLDRSESASRRR